MGVGHLVSDDRLDPRRVQQALVAMLLHPAHAARVQGPGPVPELSPRERELLRAVDPRALATDPHRRARVLHVLVEEFPVTAAVLGVAIIEAFFASPELREGLHTRAAMTAAFAVWLGDRARGVGHLESAMAAVRRAKAPAGPGMVACPPGLRGLVVPAGTLAFYLRVRDELGPDPVHALAHRDQRSRPSPPQRGMQFLLVERRPDGSVDLGTGSEPLVRLLCFAEAPRARAEVEAEALRLGAEPNEASALVDALCAEGLLWASPSEPAP
jgi:hypothetical protein